MQRSTQNPQSTQLLPGQTMSTKQRLERYQAGPKSKLLGMLLMVLVPWLMFAIANVLFAFLFHRYETLTWLSVIFLGFFAILFILVDHRNKFGGRWYTKGGFVCAELISESPISQSIQRDLMTLYSRILLCGGCSNKFVLRFSCAGI